MVEKVSRVILAAVLVTAVGAAAPTPASAAPGTVSSAGGVMTFRAAPGTANRVTVGPQTGVSGVDVPIFSVTESNDAGTPLIAGAGCTVLATTAVYCPQAGVRRIDILLGDGNDAGTASTDTRIPVKIDGGAGNDQLLGNDGPTILIGGTGIDRFDGNGGNDLIYARDRTRETYFFCDAGFDKVFADRFDSIFFGASCNQVFRPRPPAP
jgi:Ca2+-binding RTX toxin-like protein